MEKLISIVIPIYNVEKYVDRCIQSVINQTYKNIDIILVNDGSPDNCGQICEKWKKIDSRVSVIHKQNGGLSDARNAGIKVARGEFITFIDSDDYVSENYVEYLFNLICKYDADISICSFYELFEDSNKKIYVGGDREKVFNSETAIETMLYDKDFYTAAWGKLYKTSYFNDIQYPKGKLYEDLATTYKLLEKAKKIVYGPEHLYCYIQRDGSILNSKFSKKNFELLEIIRKLKRDLENRYPNLYDAILYRTVCAYMDTVNMIINSKENNYNKEIDNSMRFIRRKFMKIIKIKELSITQKVLVCSSVFGRTSYILTYKLQKTIKKYLRGV